MKIILEIFESLKIALSALRANKMRSFLASLGVVVGISIVILMGWALDGLSKTMSDTFAIIGTDMLFVDKWSWTGGKNWRDYEARKKISLEEAYQLKEKLVEAEYVIPNMNKWGATILHSGRQYSGMINVGATFENGYTPAGDMLMGRYYTQLEDEIGANVVVIAFNVYSLFFKDMNPIGQTLKIDGHKFTVIGVVKKRGTIFFDFIDNQMFIPLKSFIKIYGKNGRSVSIGVKAGGVDKLDHVRSELTGHLRTIRNVKPHEEDDFSINETKAFAETIENFEKWVWGVGIGMTMLSFVVGIIGIMNIMFVSVTERTKEIGIRKAIGAKKRSIYIQFLTEASVLCIIGALLAFVICTVITYSITSALADNVIVSALSPYLPKELLIVASITSICVGILAGFIPAYRAANLDPVDALRSE